MSYIAQGALQWYWIFAGNEASQKTFQGNLEKFALR